jgi:arabinofuranan 3-O-arabinosyltransferase
MPAAARLAERWWRLPLVFAAILFALSGPAHALGRIDAVFYATLVAVTLGAVGVLLGLVASMPVLSGKARS